MVKRNFNGGGSAWSSARDRARSGGSGRTSRGAGVVSSRPGGGNKATSNKNQINQNIKNQQNQNQQNKPKQHKLLTQLNKLQSQGKGNTSQAQVLKNYLSGVVSPQDQPGGPPGQKDTRSFDEKRTLLSDYYSGIKPTYDKKSGLPSDKLDPIKGHPLYKAGMSMTPTSDMLFGPGSVFGASTGTTASSPVVQDVLRNMMGQYYNKYDYGKKDAVTAALANYYPQVSMYDFSGPPGTTVMGSPNYMGDKTADELVASGHKYAEDKFLENPTRYGGWGGRGYAGTYGGGGGGGGWGGYGGYGGGGGGGGGYGYPAGRGQQPRGYQRAQVGPGNLQEQVNQAFLGMSGVQKKRGGIVSLLRLRS